MEKPRPQTSNIQWNVYYIPTWRISTLHQNILCGSQFYRLYKHKTHLIYILTPKKKKKPINLEREREREIMESILLKLVFPTPPSFFLNALSVMNIPSFAMSGLSEMRGQNLKYSKFSNNGAEEREVVGSAKLGQTKTKVPSKTGMLVCYTPAFLASLVLFLIFPHEGNLRMLLLNSALALHFFKRIYEVVLFISFCL